MKKREFGKRNLTGEIDTSVILKRPPVKRRKKPGPKTGRRKREAQAGSSRLVQVTPSPPRTIEVQPGSPRYEEVRPSVEKPSSVSAKDSQVFAGPLRIDAVQQVRLLKPRQRTKPQGELASIQSQDWDSFQPPMKQEKSTAVKKAEESAEDLFDRLKEI